MNTWKKYSKVVIGVLILAALSIGCGSTKEESYRMIKVMSVDGTVTVERESVGTLDAYADMKLENGDKLSVEANSSLVLNLDDDKYAMLESGTRLTLEASGTKETSRTTIHLQDGAVVNYLTKKLNEDSSYEVTVPNSTMAVRGTVFRVEVTYDENGDSYTKVQVFHGVVGSRLIFPDGSISEKEVSLQPGKEVLIHGDTTLSEYMIDEGHDIDYSELSLETLKMLKECIHLGAELSIREEECDELIAKLEAPEDEPEEEPMKVSAPKVSAKTAAAKAPVKQERVSRPAPSSKITPMRTSKRSSQSVNMEVCVIKPTTMEEAREIADTLVENSTVILNLEGIDVELAQRIIDFTSGACYSLGGSLQQVSSYIFVLGPYNVDITGDLQNILGGSVPSVRVGY